MGSKLVLVKDSDFLPGIDLNTLKCWSKDQYGLLLEMDAHAEYEVVETDESFSAHDRSGKLANVPRVGHRIDGLRIFLCDEEITKKLTQVAIDRITMYLEEYVNY